jgi:hypothetical protein
MLENDRISMSGSEGGGFASEVGWLGEPSPVFENPENFKSQNPVTPALPEVPDSKKEMSRGGKQNQIFEQSGSCPALFGGCFSKEIALEAMQQCRTGHFLSAVINLAKPNSMAVAMWIPWIVHKKTGGFAWRVPTAIFRVRVLISMPRGIRVNRPRCRSVWKREGTLLELARGISPLASLAWTAKVISYSRMELEWIGPCSKAANSPARVEFFFGDIQGSTAKVSR